MRRITLFMLCALFAFASFAKDVSQQQAQKLAGAFLLRTEGAMKAPSKKSLSLKPVYTAVGSDGKNSFYTFNIGSGDGFIIVSADDRAYEILGYSDKGCFEYDNLSPDMKSWLESYSDQISYIRKSNVEAQAPETETGKKSVAPLLGNIQWSQDSPYNDMCPSYDLKTRCASGCVATAMAQVMYYHRWPEKGRGSNTYKPSILGGTSITADFANTTYPWNDMLPVYNAESSKASREAVALLMYHCGVAVNMEYSSSSGATSESVPFALYGYFNYDKGIAYRTRINYSNAEWENIIYDELDNARPIVALGRSSSGGHCFVFDGYDENGLVHVNWGWAGMSNGYFRTTALTPAIQGIGGSDGGYNYDQYIVTGIQPPTDGTDIDVELVSTEGLVPSKETINNGETVNIRLCGMLTNAGWRNNSVEFGLKLTDMEGNIVKVIQNDITGDIELGYQYYCPDFGSVSFGNLDEGSYVLYPVCRAKGSNGAWNRIRDSYVGYPNYIYLTVENGLQKFSYPDYFKLEVNEMTAPETVYSTVPVKVDATIVNSGDVDFFGEVKVSVVNKETKRNVASGETYKLAIKPGCSSDISLISTFSLEPGEYSLTITDDDDRHICEYRDITVMAAPEEAALVEVVERPYFSDNNNVDKNSMDLTAKIICSKGVYGGYLNVYIYNESGTVMEGCLEPQYFFANEGETVDFKFDGVFENGVPGKTYVALLLLSNGTNIQFLTPNEMSLCVFKLSEASSIGETVVENNAPAAIYNINGQRLPSTDLKTAGKGLYIIKQGNKTMKVVK